MIADSVSCIEDVLEEIDDQPKDLISFHIPFPYNQDEIQYSLEDLPFQQKYLNSNIIAPLYNEFLQKFSDSWSIVATGVAISYALLQSQGAQRPSTSDADSTH